MRRGDRANLFLLSGHDDGTGVFANMGLPAKGRKPYFAFSSAIVVINSVVGGGAAALAIGVALDPPLGLAAGVGGAVALVSVVGWIPTPIACSAKPRWSRPFFPPPPEGGTSPTNHGEPAA